MIVGITRRGDEFAIQAGGTNSAMVSKAALKICSCRPLSLLGSCCHYLAANQLLNPVKILVSEYPMKAAVMRAAHQPLSIEDVQIDDPGPREVLVKTAACGVCHSDLHFI